MSGLTKYLVSSHLRFIVKNIVFFRFISVSTSAISYCFILATLLSRSFSTLISYGFISVPKIVVSNKKWSAMSPVKMNSRASSFAPKCPEEWWTYQLLNFPGHNRCIDGARRLSIANLRTWISPRSLDQTKISSHLGYNFAAKMFVPFHLSLILWIDIVSSWVRCRPRPIYVALRSLFLWFRWMAISTKGVYKWKYTYLRIKLHSCPHSRPSLASRNVGPYLVYNAIERIFIVYYCRLAIFPADFQGRGVINRCVFLDEGQKTMPRHAFIWK